MHGKLRGTENVWKIVRGPAIGRVISASSRSLNKREQLHAASLAPPQVLVGSRGAEASTPAGRKCHLVAAYSEEFHWSRPGPEQGAAKAAAIPLAVEPQNAAHANQRLRVAPPLW